MHGLEEVFKNEKYTKKTNALNFVLYKLEEIEQILINFVINKNTYMCVCVCVCVCECMCVCVCACVCKCVHTHTHAHTHAHIHTLIHTCTHTHTHAHTFTHTYTYIQIHIYNTLICILNFTSHIISNMDLYTGAYTNKRMIKYQ